MDKFLETNNLPKLNQEAESLNRLTTACETEAVIKNLSTHNSPGPDVITDEFCQTFQKELTPLLLKLFQNFQVERSFLS